VSLDVVNPPTHRVVHRWAYMVGPPREGASSERGTAVVAPSRTTSSGFAGIVDHVHSDICPAQGKEPAMASLTDIGRLDRQHLEARAADWLARHSVTLLRMSLGIVFLGFGILKFVPGLSPAEPLAGRTLDILTLGLLPERVGLTMVASLETGIGLLLLTGIGLRLALALLVVESVGIMSPIVLLPDLMFRSFPFAPTLEGQYVLKDVIVAAAALVVAARTLGARMVVRP
jgi:uncharacterized membrane protein YkgB